MTKDRINRTVYTASQHVAAPLRPPQGALKPILPHGIWTNVFQHEIPYSSAPQNLESICFRRLLHAIDINFNQLVVKAHVSGNWSAFGSRISIVPYQISVQLSTNIDVVVLRASLIRTERYCIARCEIFPIHARGWQIMPRP
jgi:hypothetical protein